MPRLLAKLLSARSVCFSLLVGLAFCPIGQAQNGPITFVPGPDGKPIRVPTKAEKEPPKSGVPNPSSSMPGKPGDKKEGDNEKSPAPKVIRRGDRVPENPNANPDELKATVGEDGKVAFQFRNQSWVELIEWLAEIADQPLDWQELPGDLVNVRSPGRYTVAETMDLFNRHLLARGYTMLQMTGGMTIEKTKGINSAIVPRVSPDDLGKLQPHTFVRTSLDVGWLSAEKLAEELTPMISSNGRLSALKTTNRIEAMDAAINLTQISALLIRERDDVSREALAPEFKLRHIAAEEAKRMLEEFLGVEKKKSAPMTPQQIQMMQRMQQQNAGKGLPTQKKVEISIVANPRQNSVIIRAPVDRIAVAREFIYRVDVPTESVMSLADVESRVAVFRLYSLDPEKLIEIISEMNILEPSTRIRVDSDNNALIVSGNAADRFIIEKLIKRLDGSGRKFEVLQLRRLDANDVAESIAFLMGKEENEDEKNSSRRYYYGYSEPEEDKNKDEFRVAANARYRQVLLWANESEMEQVTSLLVKLGELPPPGGSGRTIRRINASATPEVYEYLMQLKQQWEQVSDTPLEIPDQEMFPDPLPERQADTETEIGVEEEAEGSEPDSTQPSMRQDAVSEDQDDLKDEGDADEKDDNGPATKLDETVAMSMSEPQYSSASRWFGERSLPTYLTTTQREQTNSSDREKPLINSASEFDRYFGGRAQRSENAKVTELDSDQAGKKQSPIQIRIDSSGNLMLSSSNTKALDQLENLMLELTPPQRPYHVFQIKHQSAYLIKLNLEEYFEDDDGDSEADQMFRWWYDIDESSDSGPSGLGKGNTLRIVEDPDTRTLVVSGASPEQLKTIRELIDLWDVPEEENKRKMRFTQLVQIEYGKAKQISETIKEAYRDLLSSNDKAFSGGGGGGKGGQNSGEDPKKRGRESGGSEFVDKENGRDGGGADFSFKGKLSIGVDEIGNTLLISAEGESLLNLVIDMVGKLDRASRPSGAVEVVSLSGNTSDQAIRTALQALGANVGAKDEAGSNPAASKSGREE